MQENETEDLLFLKMFNHYVKREIEKLVQKTRSILLSHNTALIP